MGHEARRRLLAPHGEVRDGGGVPVQAPVHRRDRARGVASGVADCRTEGSGNLYRDRSRLYRSESLQENMRWKALAEMYTMHSFAPFSKRIFCQEIAKMFANFCKIQQKI